MFSKCGPENFALAMDFLGRQPELNYFMLGDLESFGLDDPNVDLWMEGGGQPTAALLRYWGNYLIHAPQGADWAHIARIMRHGGFGMLSGVPSEVAPILQELQLNPTIDTNILMSLPPGALCPVEGDIRLEWVTLGNLRQYQEGLLALRANIAEFNAGLNLDAMREELALGCKRILIAVAGGQVVSMAMTTVERRRWAMIVSVCTHRDWRGRGIAGAVMTTLCRQLADEGKTALLFYKNPVAGRLYARLGFQERGRWCYAYFR